MVRVGYRSRAPYVVMVDFRLRLKTPYGWSLYVFDLINDLFFRTPEGFWSESWVGEGQGCQGKALGTDYE